MTHLEQDKFLQIADCLLDTINDYVTFIRLSMTCRKFYLLTRRRHCMASRLFHQLEIPLFTKPESSTSRRATTDTTFAKTMNDRPRIGCGCRSSSRRRQMSETQKICASFSRQENEEDWNHESMLQSRSRFMLQR